MKSRLALAATVLGLTALMRSPSPVKAQGPVFTYLPTASTTDGRFLALSGIPLNTLVGQQVDIRLSVPSTQSSFQLGIFDGDTGGVGSDGLPHWDLGNTPLRYTLYADPLADGAGTFVVGQWNANAVNPTTGPSWSSSAPVLPDNAWWDANISNVSQAQAPSGNFFYRLCVELTDFTTQTEAPFKLRATAQMAVRPSKLNDPNDKQGLSFVGGARQFPGDFQILYPGWAPGQAITQASPTTYDGTWTWNFELPGGLTRLDLWDGDWDFGDANRVEVDDDEPDSPAYPPFFYDPAIYLPENAKNSGNPPDDNRFDAFKRPAAVKYAVAAPGGAIYPNLNPSSNTEWEKFSITSVAAPRSDADYSTTQGADGSTTVPAGFLPGGTWQVRIIGLDLANLCFLKFPAYVLGICEDGGTCPTPRPFKLGDFVWWDINRDGIQDPGEPGIPGVKINLINDQGVIIDSVFTDADGKYCFLVEAGTYSTNVDPSNFLAGGPLNGAVGTVPAINAANQTLTRTISNANVLTYDFPFAPPGALGDRVWLDLNCDGVQDGGEPGLVGVTVILNADFDNNGSTDYTTSTVTGPNGIYNFTGLPAGKYTVIVDASTLPANVAPSYDLDGKGTAHTAITTLTFGQTRTDVDFGYCGTGQLGDRVWIDTNGDGIQDMGEVGINGVTLTLRGDIDCDGITDFTRTQVTSGDGNYLFTDLPAGCYVVLVNAATLPSGLTQTFDLDGTSTANAWLSGAAPASPLPNGFNKLDVDFGYNQPPPPPSGPFRTQTQGGWGAKPNGNNPGAFLQANFAAVFGAKGGLVVGKGKTITLTSSTAVCNFLPQGGTAGSLVESLTDPTERDGTPAGVFAGQVTALKISVCFSLAGKTTTGLADLKVKTGTYAGKTVAEILLAAECALGGSVPAGYTIADLNTVVTNINENFVDGTTNKGYLIP